MKKVYESPLAEVTRFETEDVLDIVSGGTGTDTGSGNTSGGSVSIGGGGRIRL